MARGSTKRSTSRLGMEGRTNDEEESDYMLREMEVSNAISPILVFKSIPLLSCSHVESPK
jgi:hypothetical protein